MTANASTGVDEEEDEDEGADGFVDTGDDLSDSVCFFRFSSELHQLPLEVPLLLDVPTGPLPVVVVVVATLVGVVGPFVLTPAEPFVMTGGAVRGAVDEGVAHDEDETTGDPEPPEEGDAPRKSFRPLE